MADAVTKQDLVELESRLVAALRQSQSELKTELIEGVQEMVRDAQTEILKAFLPYQEGYNVRLRTMDATNAGLTERIAILERRLQEIERKLLMNPPAA